MPIVTGSFYGGIQPSTCNLRKTSKAFFSLTVRRIDSRSNLCNSPGEALHIGVRSAALRRPVHEISDGTNKQTHTHTEYQHYYNRWLCERTLQVQLHVASQFLFWVSIAMYVIIICVGDSNWWEWMVIRLSQAYWFIPTKCFIDKEADTSTANWQSSSEYTQHTWNPAANILNTRSREESQGSILQHA